MNTIKPLPGHILYVRSASRNPLPEYAFLHHLCESVRVDDLFYRLRAVRMCMYDPSYSDLDAPGNSGSIIRQFEQSDALVVLPASAVVFVRQIKRPGCWT